MTTALVNQVMHVRVRELCESRGGPSWVLVPNKPTVSVDVKQHSTNSKTCRIQPQAKQTKSPWTSGARCFTTNRTGYDQEVHVAS